MALRRSDVPKFELDMHVGPVPIVCQCGEHIGVRGWFAAKALEGKLRCSLIMCLGCARREMDPFIDAHFAGTLEDS